MSDKLHASMVGFDFTPAIHPEHGAWGTTPIMTEVDLPLLGRCLALKQDDRLLIWFALDLCGNMVCETAELRAQVAAALGIDVEQVIWSTSQTHSSPTLPGSDMPGGSSITVRGKYDEAYCDEQRKMFVDHCIAAAREAIDGIRPVQIRAGRGYCDSMSYNRRFPMPTGGVKFSRDYGEGLQSGKFFDPTIGLVVFEDDAGQPLGAIFNFCSHPATMINDRYMSSDWVGTARTEIETALDGASAMFVQGFCGDVNCYHIFGTPAQAKATGQRLGRAAVAALPNLVPARGVPFGYTFEEVELECRPMHTRDEVTAELDARQAFADSLETDPATTWFAGINAPEQFNASQKHSFVQVQIKYLNEVMRMLDAGESPPDSLTFGLGGVRIGDVGAVLAHGENFTATGMKVRQRSPFVHTLICGDTNGLFGYLGDDDEIDRGGYETNSFWKMLEAGGVRGVRLAPGKGSADRIIDASVRLLCQLQRL